MASAEIIAVLKKEKPKLTAEFGVEELALFGSYARGEATSESDVDVLVLLKFPTLHALIGVTQYLEKILNKKIDIVTKHKFNTPRFMESIEKDLIYV